MRYVLGDLLTAPEACILHGCNAQHKMASGVAKAIRAKYPEAYRVYMETKPLVLGMAIWVDCGDRIVINGITQEFYGRDPSVRYVSYDAVAKVIEEIDQRAKEIGISAVAMPKIGAGLGNGSWPVIEEIIQEYARHFEPVIYIHEPDS